MFHFSYTKCDLHRTQAQFVYWISVNQFLKNSKIIRYFEYGDVCYTLFAEMDVRLLNVIIQFKNWEFGWNFLKNESIRISDVDFFRFVQVSLQSMLSGSAAGSFADDIMKWQKRLQTIEAVLSVWLEVQDKWIELEDVRIDFCSWNSKCYNL